MENMYPAFNFTPEGTAYKNPFALASFNTSGSVGKGNKDGYMTDSYGRRMLPNKYDDEGNPTGYTTIGDVKEKRNGAVVKAFKNF